MKTVGHISWFVGSLVGCAATWYLTNRYWKERNEREVNEVRESLKAYYKEREVEKTERIAEVTRQACEIEFLGNPKPQTIETLLKRPIPPKTTVLLLLRTPLP